METNRQRKQKKKLEKEKGENLDQKKERICIPPLKKSTSKIKI